MRIGRLGAMAIIVLGLTGAQVDAQRGRSSGWQRFALRYGWMVDYRDALAKAKKTGKPLMVVLRCVP